MGREANAWWYKRHDATPTQEEALAILDTICEPYRGRDAEFESEDPKNPRYIHPRYDHYTDPIGPIGRLIAVAFAATQHEMLLEDEADEDACPWYDGPYTRFKKRYNFC
jgi:hypothetical protein